jgi:hypothetical protein
MIEVMKKNKTIVFITIYMTALLVRGAVFHFYLKNNENYWQVDSNTYHQVALGISQNKGVALPDGRPNFYRLPGYPIFLSYCYKIFGPDKVKALWFQVVLASFIPILIFFLANILFGNFLLSFLASLFSVFHLGLVLYSGFFMTETLFLLFFLIFALIFFSVVHLFFCPTKRTEITKTTFFDSAEFMFMPEPAASGLGYIEFQEKAFPHKPGDLSIICAEQSIYEEYQQIFWAGMFLGFASLIRPVGHYAVILAVIILFFTNNSTFKKVGLSLSFFIGWLIPVSCWLIRNYMLLGHVFFHTLPGGHFLYLSASRVAMHVHECSYQQAREILSREVTRLREEREHQIGRPLNEIESCKLHEKLAVKYFKMRPLVTLKNWFTDMFRATFSLYSSELLFLDNGRKEFDYFKKERGAWSMFERYLFPDTPNRFLKIIIWAEIILFLLILVGFVFGLFLVLFYFLKKSSSLCAQEDLCSWAKVLPWIAFFIVLALSGGYARMRLPVEPFLIILSLYGWINLLSRNRIYSNVKL